MQLKDEAILLSVRKMLENKAIISVFSANNGIYNGMCSLTKRTRPSLQVGSLLDIAWSARLEEHLGKIKYEPIKEYGSIILPQQDKLLALTTITELSVFCLHERHPYSDYYNLLLKYIIKLTLSPFNWHDYFQMELALLDSSGYSLDLSTCPVTNKNDELCYVSPKTGRSISKDAGAQYHNKLLPLPSFLIYNHDINKISANDVNDAFTLTTYFFERHLYKDKQMPHTRRMMLRSISQ